MGGYGWREDQSCFYRAGYYSDWHTVLAGQDTVIVNAGIDGFLTRLPNGAKVLMRRGTTGMPELAMYDYGAGKVVACGLYTDLGYGIGQWTNADAGLVRDIVTWALDIRGAIAEHKSGESVTLAVPVHYVPGRETLYSTTARITIQKPNRDTLQVLSIPLMPPLRPGESRSIPVPSFAAPSQLGIYPVSYGLYNDSQLLQKERLGVRFAVKKDIPVGNYRLGDFGVAAVVENEKLWYGDSAKFTVFVRNNTNQAHRAKVMMITSYGRGWAALGLMEAEKRFRRIKGYRSIPVLLAALQQKTALDKSVVAQYLMLGSLMNFNNGRDNLGS